MNKDIGIIFKRIALAIGIVGCIGGVIYAKYKTSTIFSPSSVMDNLNSIYIALFIDSLLPIWLITVFLCLFSYGTGHIITLLQNINQKIDIINKPENAKQKDAPTITNTNLDEDKNNPYTLYL